MGDGDPAGILVVAPINYCFRYFGTQLAFPQRDMPSSAPSENMQCEFFVHPDGNFAFDHYYHSLIHTFSVHW